MAATPRTRARWLGLIALLTILTIPSFNQFAAHAATDLVLGEDAVVANAQGDEVRLRSAPSLGAAVLTTVPEGWLVNVVDGPVSGDDGAFWYQVVARGQSGYMLAEYLSNPGSTASNQSEVEVGEAGVGPAALATTTTALNLRSAASLSATVLLVMPGGASVNTTGVIQNGFSQLTYQGTTGWAASQYLSSGGSSPVIDTAVVIDGSLNLRSGPGTSFGVLLVMPGGSEVGITGASQNGFYPVRYQGTDGWASGQYLQFEGEPAPTPPGEIIDTAVVVDGALNLRSGPGTSFAVLTVMPGGSEVGITGSSQNGFYPLNYQGTAGWASGTYLDFDGTEPEPTPPGEIIDTAFVVDGALNLRSGPGTTFSVILVMPGGSEVGITGSAQNGFYPVRYQGTDGYASAQFLQLEGEPAPTEPPGEIIDTAFVVDGALNLRSGPGTSFNVILVMPGGSEVGITGSVQNNFFPVRYQGTDGWASGTYLNFDGTEPTPPPGGSGSIVWPVSGGAWEVTQGYNGSSHQNQSSTYQYLYALDIAKQDRTTAGTAVYAMASGTVRWTERASGGIVINMGNGYAVAMFHLTVDRGWVMGDAIQQGDFIGTVSDVGGEGFVQFSHIHLTVWQSNDGGNWNRVAVPFSGQNAISGNEFPSNGSSLQWTGFEFFP